VALKARIITSIMVWDAKNRRAGRDEDRHLGQYPLDTERLGGVEVALSMLSRELLKIPGVRLHIITCKPQLDQPRSSKATVVL
jgi:hypothetical protein